jgi:hypothetical protein
LQVAIDVDLVGREADVLTGTFTDNTNGILISDLALLSDAADRIEDDILIAQDTLGNNVSLAQTNLIGTKNIGNLLVSANYVSGEGTYLHTAASDLTNAITSAVVTKAYAMGGSESFTNPATLGGT